MPPFQGGVIRPGADQDFSIRGGRENETQRVIGTPPTYQSAQDRVAIKILTQDNAHWIVAVMSPTKSENYFPSVGRNAFASGCASSF